MTNIINCSICGKELERNGKLINGYYGFELSEKGKEKYNIPIDTVYLCDYCNHKYDHNENFYKTRDEELGGEAEPEEYGKFAFEWEDRLLSNPNSELYKKIVEGLKNGK